jgi:hypothetical protein
MSTLKKIGLAIGFALFVAAVVALTVGVMENHYYDHQYDSCKKIETGTSFKGYDCGSHTIYIPKQK